MAKLLLNYLDERGVEYENSYWRLIKFQVDLEGNWAEFEFKGYATKQARQKGFGGIGTILVTVSGAEFQDYYAKFIGGQLSLGQIAYENLSKKQLSVRKKLEDGNIEVEYKVLFDETAQDDI